MFLRVDDRLVHGQVVTAWVRQLKTKRILVVDDAAAANTITRKALKMAAPKGIALKVVSVEEGKGFFAADDSKTLVIVKTTQAALAMVEGNPSLSWTVCVGNVGAAAGRKTYADTVHLTDEEFSAVEKLIDRGDVDVYMQTVPGQAIARFKK